jgi:hypothetical protein
MVGGASFPILCKGEKSLYLLPLVNPYPGPLKRRLCGFTQRGEIHNYGGADPVNPWVFTAGPLLGVGRISEVHLIPICFFTQMECYISGI